MALHNTWATHNRWAALALAALALLGSGCTPRQEAEASRQLAFTRTVDLSQVVREDVPYLPGEPRTRIARGGDGVIRQVQIGSRSGTLLRVVAAPDDTPTTIDDLSPRDLVLPAVVIDLRDQVQDHTGYRISAGELEDWERRNGSIPKGALVLLVTGWDVRWGDPATYLDLDSAGHAQSPSVGAEAALLLDRRGVIGLGIDAPDTAYTPAKGYRLLLENLTSLEQLPPTGATVVVGALKIQAAQISPARVIALIP
ncbi:MAG: cyclase family protein [Chloroflexales bacterium]